MVNISRKSQETEQKFNRMIPNFFSNMQKEKNRYRSLSTTEIGILMANHNRADNWDNIKVSSNFDPQLIRECEFFGLVRIGDLTQAYLEYDEIALPVGLSNSTIIACDIGDNVVIKNVSLLSRYIVGDECMLFNVHEMLTTETAKFGNGVVKEGESEKDRIWLEICNENGGRRVLAFQGMIPADAYIWSKFRDDEQLMIALKEMVDRQAGSRRGYFGVIDEKSVVKHCRSIKNTAIGSHAFITGVNRLENITVQSSESEPTRIVEGGELTNGIIGPGNQIYYGNKADQFVTGTNCKLKYGACLFNTYLGDNSTISCCEVLNNLIFPFHEQHHNNSFLIATTIQGQSNISAGATIGSNHNSRAADGEILAERGFWPGLCASFKHNCRFATFTLTAKGHYPDEMNITLPFSLISLIPGTHQVQILPGYWFLYNMYALSRNVWKFQKRDKRVTKTQNIEMDYLAPDTVEDMFVSLDKLAWALGKSAADAMKKNFNSDTEFIDYGKELLENQNPIIRKLKVTLPDQVNRNTAVILKVQQAYDIYKNMILFYCMRTLIEALENKPKSLSELLRESTAKVDKKWWNIGGQLVEDTDLKEIIQKIKTRELNNWDKVHQAYNQKWATYPTRKLAHALQKLEHLLQTPLRKLEKSRWTNLFNHAIDLQKMIAQKVRESRTKDFTSPFRKMMYDSPAEMTAVLGTVDEIDFVHEMDQMTLTFEKKVNSLLANPGLWE